MQYPRFGGLLQYARQVYLTIGMQLTQAPESIPSIKQSKETKQHMALQNTRPGTSRKAKMGYIIYYVVITVICSMLVATQYDIDDGSQERITVTFLNPHFQGYFPYSNVTFFIVMFEILNITPVDSELPWSKVTITIKDYRGRLLHRSMTLRADDPAAYDSSPPISVEVWYVETTPNDKNLSIGDAIKITGVIDEYEGATVEIFIGEKLIGAPIIFYYL